MPTSTAMNVNTVAAGTSTQVHLRAADDHWPAAVTTDQDAGGLVPSQQDVPTTEPTTESTFPTTTTATNKVNYVSLRLERTTLRGMPEEAGFVRCR